MSAHEERRPAPPPEPAPAAPSASPAADASITTADTADDAGAIAPPMSQHKSVLHIGDSTVGYHLGLQLELARMFKAAGIGYESHTVTSAGLRSFASEKVVEKLVAEKNPDLVIVQVGTNNLTVPNPAAYIPHLRSIVAQIGGRDCYWIGPISLDRPEKGMRRVIRENVSPCTFYDSFDLNVARQPDLIHPTQPGAKKWADAFWAFAASTPPGR